MTSVKLTDMMSAASGDVISALGTSVSMGNKNVSSNQQSFATVMNDTAQGRKTSENLNTSTNRTENNPDVKESYRANAQSDAMERKVTQASAEDSDKFQKLEENQEEITDDFAQGMKELLTEQLDVSEEELEEAMATLGLSYMDLLNPSNLTQLAAQLTETEDTCALLMNEDFTQILQQSELLVSELTEITGLSREELMTWQEIQNQGMNMEEAVEMLQTETIAADGQVLEDVAVETSLDAVVPEHEKDMVDTSERQEPMAAVQNPDAEVQQVSGGKETKVQYGTQEDERAMTDANAVVVTEEDTTEGADDFLSGQSGENLFEKDGESKNFEQMTHTQTTGFENVRTEAVPETAAQTQPRTVNVDVEELMHQFSEFTKLHVTQDTTSMDMQLNPEHLGKLYLHVSTGKEGNVTAEIAATSQEVKEALETQIAELRVNLTQQGIKVDAVEVTVASHEFEQNLEQNAARDQQQGEEQEQQNQSQVRRLFRGELDDLSGLASEEELLAARIMKDNGNSMDVTV